MRNGLGLFLVASLAGAAGCSGDSTGPSTTYDSIAGSYMGAMAGVSQGIALSGTFGLTITQNGGMATGSWSLTANLTDGVQSANIQGTGVLSGTVASGNNPSVNLIFRSAVCPNYQANFSGSYDSVNRRLTITGPVEVFAANSCTVVLSYQGTIILNR